MLEKVVSAAVEWSCVTRESDSDGGYSAVARPMNLIGHVAPLPIEVADVTRLEEAGGKVVNTKIHANVLEAAHHQVHGPPLIGWAAYNPSAGRVESAIAEHADTDREKRDEQECGHDELPFHVTARKRRRVLILAIPPAGTRRG